MDDDDYKMAATILSETTSLLVITGAGISEESGVPTYRGPNGFYQPPEDPLSFAGLSMDPIKIWRSIDAMRQIIHGKQPNPAHRILASWEQAERFDRFLIATQNIDSLHQLSGSQRVSELHGNIWKMASPKAEDLVQVEGFSKDYFLFSDPDTRESVLRRWSEENGFDVWEDRDVPFKGIPPYRDPAVRPHITLFDEPYGHRLMWAESFLTDKLETVLVIGCSGEVQVLHRLIREARLHHPGCKIINVNPGENCLPDADCFLKANARAALYKLDRLLNGVTA